MDKQIAIVSGGAQGVGLAVAQRLIAEGYKVVSFDNANHQWEHADLIAVNADVSQRLDVDRVVEMAADISVNTGPIRALVNCANIFRTSPLNSTWQQTLEDWDQIMGTNLKGTLMLSRATVPHLKTDGGHIINISSSDVLPPKKNATNLPDTDLHSASMWGLNGFTDAWAQRLAAFNIQVNAICIDQRHDLQVPMSDITQLLIDILQGSRTGENFGVWSEEAVTMGNPKLPHQRITG